MASNKGLGLNPTEEQQEAGWCQISFLGRPWKNSYLSEDMCQYLHHKVSVVVVPVVMS
jgi:hypothetical protein